MVVPAWKTCINPVSGTFEGPLRGPYPYVTRLRPAEKELYDYSRDHTKPVIGIGAMAKLDTLVHGETAFLARVDRSNTITQAVLGPAESYPTGHIVHFDRPRVADYRASVPVLADALRLLLNDPALRNRMGLPAGPGWWSASTTGWSPGNWW